MATPKDGKRNINNKKVTMRRDFPTSNKAALGRYRAQIKCPLLFTPLVSCEEKWQVFQDVIHSGRHHHAYQASQDLQGRLPLDEPEFEIAYYNEAKSVRILVNRERKTSRGKYYESKIQHLKGETSKKWWDEMKTPERPKDLPQ